MTEWLVKTFVKNNEDVLNEQVRGVYGALSSFVGIACNLFLCALKLILGYISHSVAIMSDGFNNLSDCISCIVSLIGYRLASKPADKDHPFGHGRIEYMISLIISAFILAMGYELLVASFDKAFHPVEVSVGAFAIVGLLASIGLKGWMSLFNNKLGTRLNNSAMLATAKDSQNDMIATSGALIGLVLGNYIDSPVDGLIGIIVSMIILKGGYELIKDTVDELVGKPVDHEVIDEIVKLIGEHEVALGVHDLLIHTYGPAVNIGSCHVEVDGHGNIMDIHDAIDNIEREIYQKLHIMMTIHMDPIFQDDEKLNNYRNQVISILTEFDPALSIHDFRLVDGPTHVNLVFDVVLPYECEYDDVSINHYILEHIQSDKEVQLNITFDREFA